MFFIVNTLKINNCNGTMLELKNEHYFTIHMALDTSESFCSIPFSIQNTIQPFNSSKFDLEHVFIVNTLKINNCNGTMLEL